MAANETKQNSTPKSTDRALAARGIALESRSAELVNTAYGAEMLQTSVGTVRARTGRVTPSKPGVFVAAWCRLESGQTAPFTHDDGVDYLLVTALDGAHSGSFLIPTQTLVEHHIVSVEGEGGKRGFRLYPSWLTGLNPQASRTQRWQAGYFQVFNTERE